MRFLFLLLALLSLASYAREEIREFKSAITVNSDGSLDVHEAITVNNEGRQIRHGIVREFPTRYQEILWLNFNTGFNLNSVLLNGKHVPYHVEHVSNGVKIYIGSRDRFLPHGIHTYTISYTTTRQLGFYKEYDELYYNITGNGWRLPIKSVRAEITLPNTVPADQIKAVGYTGYQGQTGTDYTVRIDDHTIYFTAGPFRSFQGLTVAITWPKGYVTEPTTWQRIQLIVDDNFYILLFLLLLITWFIISFYVVYRFEKTQRIDTIIPLFHPPKGMSPGQVRYALKKQYDATCLTAELLSLGADGFITIKEIASTWYNSNFEVIRTEKNKDEATPIQKTILDSLFNKKDTFEFKNAYSQVIQLLRVYLDKEYYNSTNQLFTFYGIPFLNLIIYAFSIGILGLALKNTLSLIGLGLAGAWLIALRYLLSGYSPQGLEVKKEIEGFKLFLSTTEAEKYKQYAQHNITPELYELYLPYAVALGVEKQWAQKCAPYLNVPEGIAYQPIWFISSRPYVSTGTMTQSLSNSLSSAISASSKPPGGGAFGRGSGSGFSGGSSGGGGGGGGGGGW